MSKSRYCQVRLQKGKFWKLLGGICLFAAVAYWGYENVNDFHPQSLVENSVLKDRNFETAVKEVISPKYKLKAYLFEEKTNPIVSISFLFNNSGTAYDGNGERGIANMVASLLTDGAGNLDRLQLKEELDSRAISIGFSAGRDDLQGQLLTTKEQSGRAFEILADILSKPRFDRADINQVKAELLMLLKQQSERPEKILALEADKALFGSHPYGRNSLGTAEDIRAITRKRLQQYTASQVVRNNLIIGIAGDISEDEAGNMLDSVFGVLPEKANTADVLVAEVDFVSGDKNIEMPLPQSIAKLAAPGITRQDKDFYPLYVANYILGGAGLTSRLSLAAREDEALTYGVYTYMSTAEKAPMLLGGFSATPENFSRVKEIVETQWRKMAEEGVTQEEFDNAKDYLLASYNLRFASVSDIAEILTAMQKEKLGIDFLLKRNEYIRNIKLHEVNNAARKYFDNKTLRFITIGNKGAGKE